MEIRKTISQTFHKIVDKLAAAASKGSKPTPPPRSGDSVDISQGRRTGKGSTPAPTPGKGATPAPKPGKGSTPAPTPGKGATPAPKPSGKSSRPSGKGSSPRKSMLMQAEGFFTNDQVLRNLGDWKNTIR